MERRKVLKSLGLGLSAGLILPELLLSCKKPDPGPEVRFNGTVAIIGAGAAGLYAADILQSKGISVVVFEADTHIGGRIRSYKTPKESDEPTASFLFVKGNPSVADFPVELGPEIVQGSDSIWGKIVNDLVVGTNDLAGATDLYILDNVAKTGADLSGDADYNAVENFVNNLPSNTSTGSSMTAASGVTARGKALLNSQAGNYFGSSSDNIDAGAVGNSLKLGAAVHDDKKFVLKATQMQDVLLTRFTNVIPTIKFSTVVQSIDYSGDKIVISDTSGAQTSVEKVIVAVPLSILKSGAISFNPGLPSSMTTSLAKFGMDASIRVILDFKSNFWGDNNTGFIWGGTTSPQIFNAGIGRSTGFRTLTFTITGPKAVELSAQGVNMISTILAELDAIYAGQATKLIRRNLDDESIILYTIQDWSKEQYIKGGFSYPLVGATQDDRVAIGTPINDKVFFAGEATAVNGDAGLINGALASSERVTTELIKSITG